MSDQEIIQALKNYMKGSLCVDGQLTKDGKTAIAQLQKRLGGYWGRICAMQEKQTQKGIRTYGQRLEENTELSAIQRLEYLEEELIDALMYIEHIKAGMQSDEDDLK